MHRGHVAVHTDAGHEADAHVDVGIVQSPGELTGEVSKLPFVLMEVVVDPQGQHAEDDDVRRGQVADVDTEGRSRADPDGEDIQLTSFEVTIMDELVALNSADGKTVDAKSDKCYICLCPFEKQTVGSLDQCHHFFCFQCIYQWSQTANTCPVDRISFAFIHLRRCPGGDIQKKVSQDSEIIQQTFSNSFNECGRSGRRDRLLVCRLCDSGYHMDCLTPPVDTVPEGDWMCPECVITSKSAGIYLMSKMITSLLLLQLLTHIIFHNVCYDGIIGGLGDSVGTNCAFAIEAF
uniref:RING-type domain-containing protein n=1 Tax=Poecilia reticulata TaxID=8081 RepID=A0A3P9QCA8_POERE